MVYKPHNLIIGLLITLTIQYLNLRDLAHTLKIQFFVKVRKRQKF